MLSDEELLALSREAFSDKQFVALTYDSGAYEITNPTVELQNFARAVERATIERCADVCAGISVDRWSQYKGREPYGPTCSGRADPGIQGQSMGADDCEIAIRAMLEEKP